MSAPTTATLTFLFTDIEGSTRLLQQLGSDYAALLAEHNRLLAEAVEGAGGRIFGTEGDAVFACFTEPAAALKAATQAQRELAGFDWPSGASVRVRMGVHTGEAIVSGDNYVGLSLHQAARIMSAGHGGQVLVSEATRRLLEELPDGLTLRDLGERRLKDLAMPERLYQLSGAALANDFPPLRTLDAGPNNLPVQLTSFIGREELAEARHALDETRLLTLSGPGGTGKTRMALQLAAEASDEFPDGVWFVPLETVREADLVPSTILTTLGVSDTGARPPLELLVEHLRDRVVLLVLDNFEQVVEAGPLLARLLREVATLKLIVTSRTVLRVYGEHEFPVPPLGLPRPSGRLSAAEALSYEAVRLFVERARAVQPAFVLDDGNVDAVVEITRRLDGLPLAIELAAARVRILPVAALRSRLDSRLATLTGGARDLPARQQTLRGAIDWSYDLLEGPDRRLFQRFGAFAGGGFLPEVERVCGPADELGREVLEGLSSLSEKSLVRGTIAGAEEPRFSMLTTLREYALERLVESGEADGVAERHARTYLELVERSEPHLKGPQRKRWLDRLALDHDNLRAALDQLVSATDILGALRFIGAAWRYWQVRGHLYEARERADQVLALTGVDEQPVAVRTRALIGGGSICYWQGDFPAAHVYYSRALDAARESGDEALLADALYNFGFAPLPTEPESGVETYRAGRPYLEQCLVLYRQLGDPRGVADASWALSIAAASNGELDTARSFGTEALDAYRELEDAFGMGWALHMLASYDLAADRLDRAEPLMREALSLFTAADDLTGILILLLDFALAAHRRGDEARHWRLSGAADRLRQTTGAAIADEAMEFIDWQAPSRPQADPSAQAAWDEGAAMSTEEAVAYALGDSRA